MVRSVVHDSNWRREWEEEEKLTPNELKEQAKIDRETKEEKKLEEELWNKACEDLVD